MARVCRSIYPKGYCNTNKQGFYFHNKLKSQIDILVKNIPYDWDFTIVITGHGEVRVGKSVLAMQIGAYWTNKINLLYHDIIKKKTGKDKITFGNDNLVFTGLKLIETGHRLGKEQPFAPLIYDEAGADLASTKVLTQTTRQVTDFYRECGQYNLLHILVLPDIFDLPISLALTRSIFLIDVDYAPDKEGVFKRGLFKFYSRPNKKMLYLKGKKERNYNAWPCDFKGKFVNFMPLNYEEYKEMKRNALLSRKEIKEPTERKIDIRTRERIENLLWIMNKIFKATRSEINLCLQAAFGKSMNEIEIAEAIGRASGRVGVDWYNTLVKNDKLCRKFGLRRP